MIADAEAAYAFAANHYPAERIVLWGESLGSGVAVALGARHRVGRIVPEGSFTSAADVGAHAYRACHSKKRDPWTGHPSRLSGLTQSRPIKDRPPLLIAVRYFI